MLNTVPPIGEYPSSHVIVSRSVTSQSHHSRPGPRLLAEKVHQERAASSGGQPRPILHCCIDLEGIGRRAQYPVCVIIVIEVGDGPGLLLSLRWALEGSEG